jgi:hypothetical protein
VSAKNGTGRRVAGSRKTQGHSLSLRLVMGGLSSSSARRHPARHRAKKCDCCHTSFYHVPLAPILQDAVWRKLAAEKEVLCVECCFRQAFERGIELTRASLRLCPVNRGGGPWAYFKLFEDAKKPSSERRPHIYKR